MKFPCVPFVQVSWFCLYGALLMLVAVSGFLIHAEGDVPSGRSRTYCISPADGNDEGDGSKTSPWKTFAPLNKLVLSPGDRVEILSPGALTETLAPQGGGSATQPITISFAPGRYDWFPERLLTRKLAISNTNDVPQGDKAIAMEMNGVQHLRVEGKDAQFFARGKMVNVHLDHARNVTFSGMSFDYHRPTVSEYTVEEVGDNHAILSIHKDSSYTLENGKIIWLGEGWKASAGGYGQIYRSNPVILVRSGSPLGGIEQAEEVSPGKVKVTFAKNPGFEKGVTYQNREILRDCAGAFCNRSTNIIWDNVAFHYVHGMGIVSQFSQDIAFRNLVFAPRKGSGRTCAAWADMLHFSGCGGKILVDGAYFSGSNDDPINIHGTYLRLTEVLSPREIKVRFMHSQTYGFHAFAEGDELAFINHETLLPYGKSKVLHARLENDKEMILELDTPVPSSYGQNDVVENTTWTPSVQIRNCTMDSIPTRGFLISTRKPIVVEGCIFMRTGMHAILVAADANSWFESGAVRQMVIRNNTFIQCAEPVICFHPENARGDENKSVHSGIQISDNIFELRNRRAVSLKSTRDVRLFGNTFVIPRESGNVSMEELVSRELSPPFSYGKNTVQTRD